MVREKTPWTLRLPVLLDVKGPLELQVGRLVVIDELRDGVVMATGHHTRRCSLGLDCCGCVSKSDQGVCLSKAITYTSSRTRACR
jgi:hypothetical protein